MNCSRHAAVLGYQSVECLDGLGIAQDAGNGPPVGRIGGLALCAGLGLHGLGSRRKHFAAILCGNGFGLRKIVKPEGGAVLVNPNSFAGGGSNKKRSNRGGGVGWNLVSGAGLHFISPKRANPADESSSHVTSDNATTVRRENNQWSKQP